MGPEGPRGKAKEELEGREAQEAVLAVLNGMSEAFDSGKLVLSRPQFEKELSIAFTRANIVLDSKLKLALLSHDGLGERDPNAEICRDKHGEPECDPELRDTENIPLPPCTSLPLPLEYESKKNKGKLNVNPLLAIVKRHCEDYLAAEVLPYRPDAWIDHDKIKVGYEIPFNRHFYEYEPSRPLEAIEEEIRSLEVEIVAMLKQVSI